MLQQAFAGLDTLICYAVKANSNQAVIATLARLGAGMDVVSEGELRRARAAGVPADKIIFAGVGKTREEMAYALGEGILGFNVESEPELEALSEVAAGLGRTARIAIRVNPDVDAKTHAKISTGKAENKFGVPFEDAPRLYAKAARLPGIAVAGIHMHIGSQITDLAPFRDAFTLMRELARDLRAEGHADRASRHGRRPRRALPRRQRRAALAAGLRRRWCARRVGGLGLEDRAGAGAHDRRQRRRPGGARDLRQARPRQDLHHRRRRHERPDPADAVRGLPRHLAGRGGRAPAGADRRRTSSARSARPATTWRSTASCRRSPAGDLVAFMTAGAYGAAMSSTYNSRLLVPEVLVKGDEFAVVRPRQTYAELIGLDRVPEWLT